MIRSIQKRKSIIENIKERKKKLDWTHFENGLPVKRSISSRSGRKNGKKKKYARQHQGGKQ